MASDDSSFVLLAASYSLMVQAQAKSFAYVARGRFSAWGNVLGAGHGGSMVTQ